MADRMGIAAGQNHFREIAVHFWLHPVCSSYLFLGVFQLAVIAEYSAAVLWYN